jgi:hypothetical protein
LTTPGKEHGIMLLPRDKKESFEIEKDRNERDFSFPKIEK